MEHPNIREPKQKRSIEKKQKIVQAGFALFCEKGYHNTNTAEIAKKAGVSTGSVYSYFTDKKSIFMAALDQYSESIITPMHTLFDDITFPFDLYGILEKIIDISLQTHNIVKSAHEEMIAMSHTDEDVSRLMLVFEEKNVMKFVEALNRLGLQIENPYEKIHIISNIVEFFCHEAIYHRHDFIDYNIMKREVIKMIIGMLSDDFKGTGIIK